MRMRAAGPAALAAIAALATAARAVPLHQVNLLAPDGQQCPLRTLWDQPCSPMCVMSVAECPAEMAPRCAETAPGTVFCQSTGTCVSPEACPLRNASLCECPWLGLSDAALDELARAPTLVPCMAFTVDVAALPGGTQATETAAECARQGSAPACPAPQAPPGLGNPINRALAAIFAIQAILLAIWGLVAAAAARRARRAAGGTSVEWDQQVVGAPAGVSMRAYRRQATGTTVLYASHGLAAALWGVMLVLTLDNYGLVAAGTTAGLLYGDYATATGLFVITWHISVLWFGVLILRAGRLRNDFSVCVPRASLEPMTHIEARAAVPPTGNALIRWWRVLTGTDALRTTVPVMHCDDGSVYFDLLSKRYTLDAARQAFVEPPAEAARALAGVSGVDLRVWVRRGGLSGDEAAQRLQIIGPNALTVPNPSVWALTLATVWSSTYLYQAMVIWVALYLNYAYIGALQVAMIAAATAVSVHGALRGARNRAASASHHTGTVDVLRDGVWTGVSAAAVVPGDVVRVGDDAVLPCDIVVASGTCVVSESALTGEPLPVRKTALLDGDCADSAGRGQVLFGTTRVLDCGGEHAIVGLVAATRTYSAAGALMAEQLDGLGGKSSTHAFEFFHQLRGAMMVLAGWGVVMFCVMLALLSHGILGSWFFGIFVASQLISPLLPAALVAGQAAAAARLRRQGIFCVSVDAVAVAGKLSLMCFDKTGTLTTQGLEFCGLVAPGVSAGPAPPRGVGAVEESAPLRIAMGVCVTVTVISNDELVGNPVDMALFRASGACLGKVGEGFLEEVTWPESGHSRLLVQRHDFDHGRQSMSVACIDPRAPRDVHVFAKGSIEAISRMCSVPQATRDATEALAGSGCYILAVAHAVRRVGNATDAKTWTRNDLERDLVLAGLVVFRNPVRPDSRDTVLQLARGNVRIVMLTGDASATAAHVARECGILGAQDAAVAFAVNRAAVCGEADANDPSRVIWTDAASGSAVENLFEYSANRAVELCLSGAAFRALDSADKLNRLLPLVRVLSRMTPADKLRAVELFKTSDTVGMCGDGGNDCAALHAANVGVALAGASASEPAAALFARFSTARDTVAVVETIAREGRAALATSTASYRFLVLYGQILGLIGVLQAYFVVVIAQPVWVLLDAGAAVGLSWALTRSGPRAVLGPRRPTARVLGPTIVISSLLHVLVHAATFAAAIALLFAQRWFRCNEFDPSTANVAHWWLLGDSYEAEVIALVTLFQVAHTAVLLAAGGQFRAAWFRNVPLVLVWSAYLGLTVYLGLAGPNPVSCMFRMNCGDTAALERTGRFAGLPDPVYGNNTADLRVWGWGWDMSAMQNIADWGQVITHHNVMPLPFRFVLVGLCLASGLVLWFLERTVQDPSSWVRVRVLGVVRPYLEARQRRRASDRREREALLRAFSSSRSLVDQPPMRARGSNGSLGR